MELSPAQARKLVLLSQGVHKNHALGSGKAATLRAIKNLGYIQIDTISVVERAHHHTLWNRVNNYRRKHLDQLQKEKQIFEYWSHAAAYLPMRDYRFSLVRKELIKGGQKHWYDKDAKLCRQILDRIRGEGPLQSRDFEHQRKGSNEWWEWKPAKRMLEQLFMEGELMITERRGFQKIYDLTERVLPAEIDTSHPGENEYLDYLIFSFLQANGLGTPAQMAYLRKGIKGAMRKRCQQLLEDDQLQSVRVGDQHYLVLPEHQSLLAQSLSRSKVKILSPFDNCLIQRARTLALFDFDYQIECYVPAAKRRYGYFCLPLLWGQKFAGRLDAKIERASSTLKILSLHIETPMHDAFLQALQPELRRFMQFNGGTQVEFCDPVLQSLQ